MTTQKIIYNKSYQPPAALVQHLLNKGLQFTPPCDQTAAEKTLSKINYYRFKSYLMPFADAITGHFGNGAEFQHGLQLYDFDAELRTLCNSYLLKLEVKLRSQLDQVVTSCTGDPFWYLDDDHFSQPIYNVRKKLLMSMERSRDEFAKHYRAKYISDKPSYRLLPPFWIAAELTTFGMLADLIASLKKDNIGPQRNNPLDVLAQRFGAKNWKELRSWVPLVKEIRNCCSHSNRTWNRNYRLPKGFVDNQNNVITARLTRSPTMKNKIYLGLAIIYIMSKNNTLNGSSFKTALELLIQRFSHIASIEYRMGMPKGWQQEPIWQ